MIKYYTISNSVVRGHDVNIKKCFISRNDAIKYMLKYYRNRFINVEVLEENSLKNHSIEYICANNNRFTIDRIKVDA